MKSIGLRLILASFLVMSGFGCAHHEIAKLANRGDLLLPDGIYRHKVAVTLFTQDQKEPRPFDFEGVLVKAEDEIKMTALSPAGLTMFRINDLHRGENVELTNYVAQLEKYRDHLLDYYRLIRVVITAKLIAKDSATVKIVRRNESGYTVDAEVVSEGHKSELHISKYDDQGIPKDLDILNDKFKINIKLLEFSLRHEKN